MRVLLLLMISLSAYGQVDTNSSYSMWRSGLSLHPKGVKTFSDDGESYHYKDTAGYGISIITESSMPNDYEVGKITITGDTMKAIRYVLEQYMKLQDEKEAQITALYKENERVRNAVAKYAKDIKKLNNEYIKRATR